MKKRRDLPFDISSTFGYAIDLRWSVARHDDDRRERVCSSHGEVSLATLHTAQ